MVSNCPPSASVGEQPLRGGGQLADDRLGLLLAYRIRVFAFDLADAVERAPKRGVQQRQRLPQRRGQAGREPAGSRLGEAYGEPVACLGQGLVPLVVNQGPCTP